MAFPRELRDAISPLHDGRVLELESIDGQASNSLLFGRHRVAINYRGNRQTQRFVRRPHAASAHENSQERLRPWRSGGLSSAVLFPTCR